LRRSRSWQPDSRRAHEPREACATEVEHRLDLHALDRLDLVIVPVLDALDAASLETALARRDVRALRSIQAALGHLADTDRLVLAFEDGVRRRRPASRDARSSVMSAPA
jgi:hypothetical protein